MNPKTITGTLIIKIEVNTSRSVLEQWHPSLEKSDAELLNPRKILQNLHFNNYIFMKEKHENLLRRMFWEGDLLENVRNVDDNLLGKEK